MSTFVPSLLDLQTNKADDSTVVHNTGNETIGGTKTFSSTIVGSITGTAAGGAPPTGSAGGDLSGTYPNPTVSSINGSLLGSTTPTSGNMLLGSGTQWVSHAMSGDATINSSGALTFATVNSNTGTFGSATQVAQLTVNGKGLITAVSNVTISGTAPGGAAGGILNGTYPNPGLNVNSTNLTTSGNTLNTVQNLNTTATPQFQALTLSGSGSGLNLTNNTITFGGIGPLNWIGQDSSSGLVFYGRLLNTIVSNAAGAATSTTTMSVQNGSGSLTAYMDWDGSTELIHAFKNINISTLTASSVVVTDSSKTLATQAQLALNLGGTNANLTASNGGIVYSTASAFAILAGTATAGQIVRSGASGAPSWSTATYPSVATSSGTMMRANGTNWVASTATFADTYTASNLLYSNGSNTVTGLATANNGVLITNSGGVPSISSTLPSAVQSNITQVGSLTSIISSNAQPLFIARTNVDLSNVTGNSVDYTVIFNTVDVNQTSSYDNTTGVFTAPTTGNYIFAGSIYFSNLGASNTLFIIKLVTTNRGYILAGGNAANMRDSNNNLPISYCVMTRLSSGNTVSIDVNVSGGTQVVGLKGTAPQISNFSGYLLP